VVVTFTTSADDKAVHKVTVGNNDNQGMWMTKTEEREGVFLISNPDLAALRLPLLQPPPTATSAQAPQPSASPSPTVSGTTR
jgi:hypothetical protein